MDMKNKYLFVLVMLLCIAAAGLGLTTLSVRHQQIKTEEDKITVVTSFYPMYVAAMNVIGDSDQIELENLSEPQTGCLHDYQLTPEDMKLLSTADVFIVNGGGIESFLSDVAEAYPDLTIIQATDGIDLVDDNPHAWMSLSDYKLQVENIEEGLKDFVEKNPVTASLSAELGQNAHSYIHEIEHLEAEAAELRAETEGAQVITFHEAYAYLAEELGMDVVGEMDLDEERQISAGEVASMVSLVRKDGVKVILAEELYGKSMGDAIQAETVVNIVYLDPLTRGNYEADGYLKAMENNLELLKKAFS